MSTHAGRARGENRFYNPPPIRERQKLEEEKKQHERRQQRHLLQIPPPPQVAAAPSVIEEPADDRASSSPSSSGGVANLDRFIESTTPLTRVNFLPKTSIKGWRRRRNDVAPQLHPYFVLGDLWDSLKEWSAYGAGVPLMLNRSDSVIQYYVPYLSAIQIYLDPSKPPTRIRRHGDDSDADSSMETSSDGSSDYGAERRNNSDVDNARSRHNVAAVNGLVLPRGKSLTGSSSDESEICNPPGQLVFEYMEHDKPFNREPLTNKIQVLASQFPELRTYKSCDLSPSSWVSVAWYPIYRIPTGPTLQSLDASFLTFHSLSTPLKGTSSDRLRPSGARPRDIQDAEFKLLLPTFGLAFYKFKDSFWNHNGVCESQKANSLFRAAENWLRLLHVYHPDFTFFATHNTPRR